MAHDSYLSDITGIELRLFHYFVTVAEELHFGRAAERIGIAQPPLSQQIRKLEQRLGVVLLQRTKRQVSLTDSGRVFLEAARGVLAQAEQAVVAARRAERGEVGRLTVGMVSSATYEDVIPGALRRFHERHPEVELSLHEWSTAQQIELLHRGEIDVGFVRPPLADRTIALETVAKEPLVAALPASHRLAASGSMALPELSEDGWVMLPRPIGPGFYDLVLGMCLRAGFSPRVAHEATQIHTLIGLVSAGLGVTLVPAAMRNLRRRGVVYAPLADPGPPAEIAAGYLKGSASPVLRAFLKVLREEAKQL